MIVGGRSVFKEFLETEYSVENLLFWMACEELRTLDTSDKNLVEDRARIIYENYISIFSDKEVKSSPQVFYLLSLSLLSSSKLIHLILLYIYHM